MIRNGRIALIARGLIIAGVVAYLVSLYFTRSLTIGLLQGHRLTFSMRWGWAMHERVNFSHGAVFGFDAHSPWLEIIKKPYDSGLALYRSADGRFYYAGTGYQLIVIDIASGSMRVTCDRGDLPRYTPVGEKLSIAKTPAERESIDPQGVALWEYIEPDQSSAGAAVEKVASKYYADVDYLGKFGLVRSSRRGNEIRFAAPDTVAEPRLALGPSCG
jgi:hypothetical protein